MTTRRFPFRKPSWSARSRAILLFLGLAALFGLLRSMGVTSEGKLSFNDLTVLTKENPLNSAFEVRQRVVHFAAFFLLAAWTLRDGQRRALETAALLPLYLYLALYISAVDTPADPLFFAAMILRRWLPISKVALIVGGLVAVVMVVLLVPGDTVSIGDAVKLTKDGLPSPDALLASLFSVVAPSLFAWISFELLLRLREDQAKLQAALQDLRDSRQQELRFLALEERAQLSRELHDTIGHHITALNMHAQRAQLLAGQGRVDERIRADLAQIRTQGGEVVRQLAAVVQTLRDPAEGAGSLVAALSALCSQWPVTVHLTLPEQEPSLSAAVRVTLYRVCQEALTNAAKHAPNEEIYLNLHTEAGQLTVTARNRLVTVTAAHASGQGLRGLSERLTQVGGTLESGRVGDDFVLTVRLPTEAPASALA